MFDHETLTEKIGSLEKELAQGKEIPNAHTMPGMNGQSIPNLSSVIEKLINERFDKIEESIDDLITKKLSENSKPGEFQLPENENSDHDTGVKKHVLIVQSSNSKNDNENKFDNTSWARVLTGAVAEKLEEIPITSSSLTKEGKGYLAFPTDAARRVAKETIENENPEFVLESSDVNEKNILPKIKICNLDTTKYTKDSAEKLKKAILKKNDNIRNEVHNSNATFDVVFIYVANENEIYGYAVIKVDPKIRDLIKKNNWRIFIDNQSHHIKDQFHLVQCFQCQRYGHKKGSPHCSSKSEPVCLYCSGNHTSKACKFKRDKSQHKCINCVQSTIASDRNSVCHTSTSNQCPLVQRETMKLIRRTVGLDPKNFQRQRTPMWIQPQI